MGKKKFLIGGIIICLAIGYLCYTGFQSTTVYYYTVSELEAMGSSIYGENIRVNGAVVPGTLEQDTSNFISKFTLIEGEHSLPIVYHGAVPDTFREGADVVVEGHLNSANIFEASAILTKCPSKYSPQE